MRKIVVSLFLLLTVTGLPIAFQGVVFGEGSPVGEGTQRFLSLVHYWGGLMFLVMFPLYAWDHIGGHLRWLRRARLVTFSGGLQTVAAGLLMLSGLVIIAYGEQAWQFARDLHHWLTYPMAASVGLHYLADKRWRKRPRPPAAAPAQDDS